ncbi:hypothetical protein LguiA_001937 [Lonicera macranthoides]
MAQQKKGQRPKHGTLEIEKEEGLTISARPSKSSTLEDLFSKCTGRRSNDSEEVSLSPLRILPGHSAGSPTVELYRIARHERPSRLRYINSEGELDYCIPTKADLESLRRLELLCQRLREIDLIFESPSETSGEIRRGSSFSKSGCFSFLWARKCAEKAELEDELTDMEISSPKMQPGDVLSAKSSGRLREATRPMHPKYHPNKTKFEDTFSSQAVDLDPEPQSMAVDLNPEYKCRRKKHLSLATRKKKSQKAAINLNLKLHTSNIWGRERLP